MAESDATVEKSFLQLAVERALAAAPKTRDYYDRLIQERTGKKGKALYDIQRGKSKKPSGETLALIAEVLERPVQFFMPAAEDIPPSNGVPFQMEGASEARMRYDVPVFGTALGADEIVDGEHIEQTMLNTGEVITYLRRPVILDGRADVYGIYVQGSSMAPRYRDGATIYVENRKPPRIGDDVVVYLRDQETDDGERACGVLVKALVKKSASFVELEQYTPALTFRLPMERVLRIDRVLTFDEMVA